LTLELGVEVGIFLTNLSFMILCAT